MGQIEQSMGDQNVQLFFIKNSSQIPQFKKPQLELVPNSKTVVDTFAVVFVLLFLETVSANQNTYRSNEWKVFIFRPGYVMIATAAVFLAAGFLSLRRRVDLIIENL